MPHVTCPLAAHDFHSSHCIPGCHENKVQAQGPVRSSGSAFIAAYSEEVNIAGTVRELVAREGWGGLLCGAGVRLGNAVGAEYGHHTCFVRAAANAVNSNKLNGSLSSDLDPTRTTPPPPRSPLSLSLTSCLSTLTTFSSFPLYRICMCLCVYVCVRAHRCVWVRVCVRVFVYVPTYNIYIYTHIYTHIQIHIYKCVYIYTSIYINIHTYVYIYTHTYIIYICNIYMYIYI